MPQTRLLKTSLALIEALTTSLSVASADPIQVCYTNDSSITVQMGLQLPAGEKHFSLAAGQSLRTEGDSDGAYCVSATYTGSPENCPVDSEDTDGGIQIELQCT
jgi:hypothetical protein